MARPQYSAMVRQLWPLLFVQDMDRSLRFYRDQLGFSLVGTDGKPEGQMRWCRMERGGASFMLQQGEAAYGRSTSGGREVCLYFICDDAEALHSELLSRGLRLNPPRVAYYGMKQLFVPEPDGHAICFESPTEDWAG